MVTCLKEAQRKDGRCMNDDIPVRIETVRAYNFFFESKHFIYSVRNVHSRETEQHYLNIVM